MTAKANKRAQFGYGLNYLIDVEHAVIVDVEPTAPRTYDEIDSTKAMPDRTKRRFSLKPKRLAADIAHGTGRFLDCLLAAGSLHICVRDDGTFSRSDFPWDKRRGVYICPTTKCYTPPAPCTTATRSTTAPPNLTAMLAR